MGCNCESKDELIVQMVDLWRNTTWKSNEEKAEANRRVGICLTAGKDNGLCGFNKNLDCNLLGLWIPAVVRNMDSRCPINKWNE